MRAQRLHMPSRPLYRGTGEAAKAQKGLRWNLIVRGLTTVLRELMQLIEEHNLDFVVLIETKLRKGSHVRCVSLAACMHYVIFQGLS